jgi:P-type Cu2+ transporter
MVNLCPGLSAGVFHSWGIVLSPAAGAALMALSSIIVAINANFYKSRKTAILSMVISLS